MKVRKKPIIVDAELATEETDIHTLEGVMHANKGDWIITGVNGEKYPCKPDIFYKTYDILPDLTDGINANNLMAVLDSANNYLKRLIATECIVFDENFKE